MVKTSKICKIQELFDFDINIKQGPYIIGTDEAGRGPGAGPVVAAAVCFKNYDESLFEKLSILNDSKKLSHKNRVMLYDVIVSHSVYSIAFGSVDEIEKNNILNTSLDCMKRSCLDVSNKLNSENCHVLVDGNRLIKNFNLKQNYIVKGDAKSASIAAASILAKVTRDNFMDELALEYPHYHWEKNKGYLTEEHINAIKKYGATKWHRPKFLEKIYEKESISQLGLF